MLPRGKGYRYRRQSQPYTEVNCLEDCRREERGQCLTVSVLTQPHPCLPHTPPPSLTQHLLQRRRGKRWLTGGRVNKLHLLPAGCLHCPVAIQRILPVVGLSTRLADQWERLLLGVFHSRLICFIPLLFSVFLQTLKIMSLKHLQVIRRCGCQAKVSRFLLNGESGLPPSSHGTNYVPCAH